MSTSPHTYDGNCHCGAVRFTISFPAPIESPETRKIDCNCSICVTNGYLLVYPQRTDVVFHSGYDTLTKYKFGSGTRPHKFCPVCGTSIMIDFETKRDYVAINVRTLERFQDVREKSEFKFFDGYAKIEPQYSAPK